MIERAKIPADMGDKPKRFIPDDETLYYADNGAVLCGAHLGSSAAFTGCDISGEPIQRLTAADAAEWADAGLGAPKCETCGGSRHAE
jgi:hypothetical protein